MKAAHSEIEPEAADHEEDQDLSELLSAQLFVKRQVEVPRYVWRDRCRYWWLFCYWLLVC